MPTAPRLIDPGAAARLTIPALLAGQAERAPNAVALLAPGRGPLTYQRLWHHVQEMAQALTTMGFSRHDRIAVVLPSGPEMATAFFAVSSCATCAPLNPAYGPRDFAFYLEDLDAKALLVQAGMNLTATAVAQARGLPVIELEPRLDAEAGLYTLAGVPHSHRASRDYAHPDDVALVLHTSGTTSRPKRVPLTHVNVCVSAHNTRTSLALTARDRFLHTLPLFHTYGLVSTLLASVGAGGSVVSTPGFIATEFLRWLTEFRPTWYAAVPTVHQAIVARAARWVERSEPRPLRLIFSSGAGLSASLRADLGRVFRVPVVDAYGMTEAAGQITCDPLPPQPRSANSVGVPTGVEIAVMRSDGVLAAAAGEVGEIVIRGANVIQGYEGNPDANAAAFIHGWFKTGDQGYVDTDGFVFITGRLKEIINRGGEKIGPLEVDAALLEHPAVVQAATFAVPDDRLGEDLRAAVVLRPGSPVSANDIREFLATRLPTFKVPRRILLVNDIPKGPTGKIQRLSLAQKLGEATAAPARGERSDAGRSRSPVEDMLIGLWTELLGTPVGLDDDFFVIGGDSLLAAQLLARVNEATGAELSLLKLFENPSVAELARCVEAGGEFTSSGASPLLETLPRRGPLPLSAAQKRLWFLEQLDLRPPPYNLVDVMELHGTLHVAALTQALQDMVRRHEVLRTTFVNVDGEPHQVVQPFTPIPLSIVDLQSGSSPGASVETLAREEARPPIDLERGPLIRATLMRLAAQRHVLCIVMHDIVCDGWALGIFWRELASLYEARLAGTPTPLPPLAVQYVDFAHWQRQWLHAAPLQAHAAYWRSHLAGARVLELRTDYERPPRPASVGVKHMLALGPSLTRSVRVLAQGHTVTLFMTLLAAFQVLLHRYTGHEDVALGSLVANRTRPGLEGLMGFFTNTVVLRTDLSGDPPFHDVLGRVRKVVLDAVAHQDLPFEQLLEVLQPRREPNRHPLFQILFVLNNTPEQIPRWPGLTARRLSVDTGTARFDLALELWQAAEGIQGWIEYRADLFDATTIARMVEHFRTLLWSVTSDPRLRLSTIPLSTRAERERVLGAGRGRSVSVPGEDHLHRVFEAQAARSAEAVALMTADASVTYDDVNRRANQVAHHLWAMGVRPGEFVGLCLPRSVEMVVGLLGILKAGAVYVALDPAYPRERLAFMLGDAGVTVALTQEGLVARLPWPRSQLVCLDTEWPVIAGQSGANPTVATTADQAAYLLYTSGSTGQPKGVVGLHRAALNALRWMWNTYPFAVGETCCHKSSISFGDAIQELLGPLLGGVCTVLIPDDVLRDIPCFVQALAAHRVTRTILVPSLLRVLLDEQPALVHQLPDMVLWLCSGEILPEATWRAFRERMPHARLVNIYGASEMSDDVTWYEPDATSTVRVTVPIGRPVDNMHVYVLDEHRQLVPLGITGELYVSGVGLTRGYLNRPDLTAERFLPHPFSDEPGARLFRTGDLARHRPDLNLEFLGRVDDQIKLRGYRIEPREIEIALERHRAIRQALVVAREDSPGDQTLVAYIVVDRERLPSPSALRRRLRARLPEYMVPAAFVVLDRIPLTPSGKVDRRALPAPDRRGLRVEEAFVAPRSGTEEVLAGIWTRLLGVERVGVDDNFFDLGGHSLLAMQLLARVHAATRVRVPLLTFFEAPTVSGMGRFIESVPVGPPSRVIPALPRRRMLPASWGQEHLWHLDRRRPRVPVLNIAYAVRVAGVLDVTILERSVATLVDRHETLRTTFRWIEGQLIQIVAPQARVPVSVIDLQSRVLSAQTADVQRLARELARKPFDLERGPLVRLRAWRLDDEESILLVSMHHIISDGWSVVVFLRELATSYGSYARGVPPRLPALPIQYADVAGWQRHWSRDPTLQSHLAYWKRNLQGPWRAPALPTNRPWRPGALNLAVRLDFVLPRGLSMALAALAQREGYSGFMIATAAVKVLLCGYTGDLDQRVATFLANRQRPETEGMIGLLADTVILRTNLGGNPTGRDVLRRVRETCLKAYTHQEFPFEVLVRGLERERGLSRAALSRVMIVWQSALRLPPELAAPPLGLLEVDQEWLGLDTVATTFDVVLELRESGPGLSGSCFYNASLLDEGAIRALLMDWQEVLERLIVNPDQSMTMLRPRPRMVEDGPPS